MAKETSKEKSTKKRRWRVSRRGFLIGLGVTGTGLALGWRFGLPEAQLALAQAVNNGGAPGNVRGSPTAWFEVLPNNQISLYMPKVEMGQGVHTSLAQIAAEELEVEFEQLEVVSASTLKDLRDPFGTGGSSTINSLFTPLRESAAILREMLKAKAADVWGIEAVYAVAMKGQVFQQNDPNTSLSYGEIVAGVSDWDVPKKAPALKPKSEFQFIGKSLKRLDFEDKLTGRAVYGYDVRVPDMLYGAVARPPSLNAKLVQASAGRAREQAGVVEVIIEEGFAGVVATTRAKAQAGVAALELQWEEAEPLDQSTIEGLTTVQEGKGTVIQREGRVGQNLSKGKLIEAEYRTPMAAHAHLEPQAAMVHVEADKVTAQVSTQSPKLVADEIAELLGRKKDEVEVTATYLGGGFGRRLNVEVALEAARLSRAVAKPVHVGWNRTEEFRNGYLRPATHSVFKAAIDDSGTILAMEHQQASGDVAFPFFPAIAASVLGADFGAWRGSIIHYKKIPHLRTRANRVKLPLRTGWWRGLGLLANTFAVEGFVDELAHEAGVDPLAFRLRHLGDDELSKRFKTSLEAVAERAGWGELLPEGRARGIACSVDVRTVVSQVAEVSVSKGKIKVHKMTASVDPGFIVNPDGVKAQTQGSIVMGLSSTFLEKIVVKDNQIEAANFDRYPLLTIEDTPEIDIVLLESGDVPFGMGEPPIGPVAAAVANAVFALTGKRLRELPLKLA